MPRVAPTALRRLTFSLPLAQTIVHESEEGGGCTVTVHLFEVDKQKFMESCMCPEMVEVRIP